MDDLLTELVHLGSVCTRHWQWVVAGIVFLYFVWYRQATSVVPSRRGAMNRRYHGS